ncbi:MAG: glutamate--tRNA ligase [Candidatus Dojkabacteria bacterium]|nr:MAG: glutamate--tRNA ligase [Candidatus Dojkabacteria bacterium]
MNVIYFLGIMAVRVRFAPSPTGWIHIGNMRTVLFGYLFAKKEQGQFILRIEDTDQKRKVPNGIKGIVETLEVMGMTPDEGPGFGGKFGPYVQSERLDIYKKYSQELIEKGQAYYCFCSAERLTELREQQKAAGVRPMYDGHCKKLTSEEVTAKLDAGESHVVRMIIPKGRIVEFEDVVYGKISFNTNDVDEQVLIKSDGFPTYQFAVVIDDHLMEISHIMRGEDWLSSTPKQLLLYEYLGWEVPRFVHVPNVLNADRKGKLSKRKGAVAAIDFIRQGYIREALFNFLCLVGWNPDPKVAHQDEFYSQEFLTEHFDINRIKRSGGALDMRKLDAINTMWLQSLTPAQLFEKVMVWKDEVAKKYVIDDVLGVSEELAEQKKATELLTTYLEKNPAIAEDLLTLVQPRIKKLSDIWDWYRFILEEPTFGVDAIKSVVGDKDIKNLITQLQTTIMGLSSWDQEPWEAAIRSYADSLEMKHGDLFMILRVIVTGRKVSPPLRELMVLLGKDFVTTRFQTLLSIV